MVLTNTVYTAPDTCTSVCGWTVTVQHIWLHIQNVSIEYTGFLYQLIQNAYTNHYRLYNHSVDPYIP